MNKGELMRLATKVLNTPLLLTPQKHDAILAVLGSRIGLDVDAPGSVEESMESNRNGSSVRNNGGGNIAIISIHGSLAHRAKGFDSWSGMTSYERIRKDLRSSLKDPDVSAILFDIASSGGEVSGCFDLVDEIHAAREHMPIYAFINEHAYSAGYAIACACEKVYLPRTGGGGSIGVRYVHVDQSEFDKKIGVKYTAMYCGEAKNDFDPHSPLPAEVKAKQEASLAKIHTLFCETVARNRGMAVEKVKGTQANVFMGEALVNEGLADGIMTFDQVIEQISKDLQEGGPRMSKADIVKRQMEALMKGSSDEENQEALAALGFVPTSSVPDQTKTEAAHQEAIAAAIAAAKEEVTTLAVETCNLCNLAELPKMAASLIGSSLEEVGAKLTDAKALKADQETVLSTLGHSPDAKSPLVADAEQRAASRATH